MSYYQEEILKQFIAYCKERSCIQGNPITLVDDYMEHLRKSNPTELKFFVPWTVSDIQGIDSELTTEEALDILERAVDYHDANEGINWYYLECCASTYQSDNNHKDEEDDEEISS